MMKVKEALELPESMWSKLDEEVANLKSSRPPDTFTRVEFQHHQGDISEKSAQKLLLKLARAGKVRKLGGGNMVYYQLVK